MPRAVWPIVRGRPRIQVVLPNAATGSPIVRDLLSDTGAGSLRSGFEIVLARNDCIALGGLPVPPVQLAGAYAGTFPVYLLRVRIPSLGFDRQVRAAGVAAVPADFDGIACFKFLSRFTYGNFGVIAEFGLET